MPLQYTLRRSTIRVRFPNRIREYRLQAGLSQKRLGAPVGKGRSMISSWERGRSLPSLTNVLKLARALSTLVESLYAGLYCPAHEDAIPDAPPA